MKHYGYCKQNLQYSENIENSFEIFLKAANSERKLVPCFFISIKYFSKYKISNLPVGSYFIAPWEGCCFTWPTLELITKRRKMKSYIVWIVFRVNRLN